MRAAVAGAVFVAAVAGVAALQPSLATKLHDAKAREDVYLFPPSEELRVMTLGWTAATTDLLWAKMHVEFGMHWSEKREFPHLERYVDAILALEPDYRPLYLYVDTMLVYRPPKGTEQDARRARAYLERGTRELPDDYKVWQHYGEFLAFLAPSWLGSDEERDAWRRDGAAALLHAVELGGDATRAVPAATVLSKDRELRAQTMDHLRRAYVLTDDPEERAGIAAKLAQLEANSSSGPSSREAIEKDMAFIDRRWARDYPFVGRGTFLIVGPAPSALKCAGRGHGETPECAREWDPVLPSRRDL